MPWVCISSQASRHSADADRRDDQAGEHPDDAAEPLARDQVDHLDRDVRVVGDQHAGDDERQPDQAEPGQLAGPRPAVDRQVALRGLQQHQTEDQQQGGDADGQLDRGEHPAEPGQPRRQLPGRWRRRVGGHSPESTDLGNIVARGCHIVARPCCLVPCAVPPSTTSPRAAGVATSTVSRAFSQPGRVSAATRERVLAVAAELGYRPNPHARALLSGKHHTAGDGGLRHHQPALLRADPGRRAAGPAVGVHAAPGQRRGVPPGRVGADPAALTGRRRLRPGRQPPPRREPPPGRRPASRRPDEPRAARPRQRRARPRRGLPPDRGAPRLARPPRRPLPRRPAQLLDGRPPGGRRCRPRPSSSGSGPRGSGRSRRR